MQQFLHRQRGLLAWIGVFWAVLYLSTQISPPFASPDETSHLYRAAMIAEGQWLLAPAPPSDAASGGGSGGLIDEHWLLAGNALTGWIAPQQQVNTRTPASLEEVRHLGRQLGWKHELAFAPASGTGYYNPLIYLPQATALWIGKHAGLSVIRSHDLVRVLTSLSCLVLVVLALRLAAFPPVALGLLATPMALFQWFSPTIDGLTMGLTLYAMALFFSELSSADCNRTRTVLLGVCVMLIITTRIHMAPLLGLPLYLAWRKRSLTGWAAFGCALAMGLLWNAFALHSTIDTRIPRGHSTGQIIALYLQHPDEFAGAIWRTVTHSTLQLFYVRSLVGMLGWLDAPITDEQVLAVYTVLGFLLALSWRQFRAGKYRIAAVRLLLLAIALGSLLITFAALAATWNDYPAAVITGLQGRYFILPLFIAACALWQGPRSGAPVGDMVHAATGPARTSSPTVLWLLLLGGSVVTAGMALAAKY